MLETLTRVTIFSGSLLLFLIQPLFARMVLPLLGGSAQVWNTCILFFTTMLLLGYAYAHILSLTLRLRTQLIVHGIVVLAGLLTLPLAVISSNGPPEGAMPVFWLLKTMAAAIGLPVFALAATSPLLSRWYAHSGECDPYFLYAASNAGSLLALAAYPFLLDPFSTLGTQTKLWSWAYALFAGLILLSALKLQGEAKPQEALPDEEMPRGRWCALAFVVASLMLGVTAHMTQEVPSIPLLWVIPLMLYLLSFIMVFAKRKLIPHDILVAFLPVLIGVLAIILFVPVRVLGFSLHLLTFFATALVLHGELAKLRPSAGRLTEYYLWIAIGGALGSAFNALAAPLVFSFIAEYPIAVVLSCLLLPQTARYWLARDFLIPLLMGIILVALFWIMPPFGDARDIVIRVVLLFFMAMVAVMFRNNRLRFGLAIAAVLAGGFAGFRMKGVETMARSYYGAYRITRVGDTERLQLFHGTTIHGAQDWSLNAPISYFHPGSPVAHIFLRTMPSHAKVGVIGLGVGALAHYTRGRQDLKFFEIDPQVVALAQDSRYFSFLQRSKDSLKAIDIVVGDGRLMIAREEPASFNLIVADAFSSNAVPIHLLTREAFEIYLSKLAPGGAILMNTSNRHLRLNDIGAGAGKSLGLSMKSCLRPPLSVPDKKAGKARASWLLMARTPEDLYKWTVGDCWVAPELEEDAPFWTDSYASLLPFIRW